MGSVKGAGLAAAVAASLAGLLFGFDTAVIAGATQGLRDAFGLDAAGLGLAVSAALFGTLVGSIFAGAPGDRYGSRTVLMWIAVLYLASSLVSALSWDLWSLFAARFVTGLAIGASSVLAPVYIAEISPAERRGRLVALFQMNIVIGILAAYLSNFAVGQLVDGNMAWRAKLAVAVVPAVIFWVVLMKAPQSPRWLARVSRTDEAEAAIERLGMGEPRAVLAKWAAAPVGEGKLSWSRHRTPILLALGIAAFNQFSGINAILYYLGDIFAAAGFDQVSSDLQSVAIGAANLLATLLALTLIDSLGRKPLLMIGGVGCAAALAATASIYSFGLDRALLLPCLVIFIGFFAVSQGAVIWVYLSEIFPTDVRARGQAIGSGAHWGLNAVIAFVYPIVAAQTLALPFWLFAAVMALQVVVVWRWFPETRGRSLEAVESDLSAR
jgi:sugar porter (SP) family MFS transporter